MATDAAAMGAGGVEMKRSLTLTGVTVNAMALIAPGAFLWTTFQVQSALTRGGSTTAADMWPGLLFSLVLAMLTAYSYAELARIYPDAGTGSSYYFAEAAFLEKESPAHRKWARFAKLTVGWISHLYYWIYPGIMVAFTATLFAYIYSAIFHHSLTYVPIAIVAVVFAFVAGYIAFRGISGSTMVSIVILAIQIVSLLGVSIWFIAYRFAHPHGGYEIVNAANVIIPHSYINMLYQSTIAILLLVGFESVTALGAEAINPEKDIKRGVLISLAIQGGICYLIQYFAANFAVGKATIQSGSGKSLVTGYGAAAVDSAPIGTMLKTTIGPGGTAGVGARRDHGAARADRYHLGLPQRRRPGDVLHGEGQGDAGRPRVAPRALRDTARRHLGAGRVVGRAGCLRGQPVPGRQPHPDHPGIQHRHVHRLRVHVRDRDRGVRQSS